MKIMTTKLPAKKTKRGRVFASSLGLLIVFIVCSAFAAPFNVNKSETSAHNDVISQSTAKKQVKQAKAKKAAKDNAKADDAAKKANTQAASSNDGNYLSKLSSISPSSIKAAASSQTKAAQLIQNQTSLTQAQSQQAAQVLFSNSKYTTLRNEITSGNWFGAYSQYQKLSNDGSLKDLQQSLK